MNTKSPKLSLIRQLTFKTEMQKNQEVKKPLRYPTIEEDRMKHAIVNAFPALKH